MGAAAGRRGMQIPANDHPDGRKAGTRIGLKRNDFESGHGRPICSTIVPHDGPTRSTVRAPRFTRPRRSSSSASATSIDGSGPAPEPHGGREARDVY